MLGLRAQAALLSAAVALMLPHLPSGWPAASAVRRRSGLTLSGVPVTKLSMKLSGVQPTALQAFRDESGRSLRALSLLRLRLFDGRAPEATPDSRLDLSQESSRLHGLKALSARLVNITAGVRVQLTYSYKTNDITKNFPVDDAINELDSILSRNIFRMGTLQTSECKYEMNLKRGSGKFRAVKNDQPVSVVIQGHDMQRHHLIPISSPFLQKLNITTSDQKIKVNMAPKFNQIQKFVEIISNLVEQNERIQERKQQDAAPSLNVVDMGCGLGYLTFACHQYLTKEFRMQTIGVESRLSLVNKVNAIAKELSFDGLEFVAGTIDSFHMESADILIALHACDTATDEAIFKGVQMKSDIIVVAPCCQKEIRRQLDATLKTGSPLALESEVGLLLSHGTYRERMSEMVTDTARALLLDIAGYQTNLFEFVGGEHTVRLCIRTMFTIT